MRRTFTTILALSLVFAGCKAKELLDKSSIQNDLDKRGTIDLMKEVANDKYDPPKDGKLTDGQIQMYLKVREHEKAIAKVAAQNMQQEANEADKSKNSIAGMMKGLQAMGSAAQMATADIRAAKDLHYNSQEYLWVKAQIMAVSMTAFTEKVSDAMQAQVESSRSQMRKAYDEAKDEQSKQMAKQMLDQYEKTAQEGHATVAQADPAVAYNRELLKKYDTELAAFATEMGKYESKDGEAKKSMDDLQKKLDQAAQDAKKSQ
jgi:hypothetical protein